MSKKIGTLVAMDPSQNFFGKHIRMKINVDITKPLKRGLSIVVGGEKLWLPIKYEGLPIYCYHCSRIGHSFKDCEDFSHMVDQDPQEMPFGPVIKASPLKKPYSWTPKNTPPRDHHRNYPHHRCTNYSPTSSDATHTSTNQKQKTPPNNAPALVPPLQTTHSPQPDPKIVDPSLPINRKLLLLENSPSPHSTQLTQPSHLTVTAPITNLVNTASPHSKIPSPNKNCQQKKNSGKDSLETSQRLHPVTNQDTPHSPFPHQKKPNAPFLSKILLISRIFPSQNVSSSSLFRLLMNKRQMLQSSSPAGPNELPRMELSRAWEPIDSSSAD